MLSAYPALHKTDWVMTVTINSRTVDIANISFVFDQSCEWQLQREIWLFMSLNFCEMSVSVS